MIGKIFLKQELNKVKINPIKAIRGFLRRGDKIAYDRIDNPVEAYLFPPLENGEIFERLAVKSRDYRREMSLACAKENLRLSTLTPEERASGFEVEREGRGSRLNSEGFEVQLPWTHFQGTNLSGKLEKSYLDYSFSSNRENNAARCRGSLGDVFLEKEIKLNPQADTVPEAPYYTAEGQIGGLAYRETYFRDSESRGHSVGKLGNMEIKKTYSRDYDLENNGYLTTRIEGRIGRYRFQEVIVDKSKTAPEQ